MTDAELLEVLNDARPRPAGAWAARLDAQVERGFATAPKRRRSTWERLRMPTFALGTVCAVVLLIAVTANTHGPNGGTGSSFGSGGGGNGGSSASSANVPASKAPSQSAGGGSRRAAPVPGPAVPPVAATRAEGRKVERAADMTLSAPRDRVSAVADGVVRATEAAGGFVASSNVSSGKAAGADFTLRVPSAALARTLSVFATLGHVESLNQSTTDITGVVNGARGRLRDRLAERASLRRQLAATSDPALAEKLKAQLRRATRRVEAAQRALARQRGRASFATVVLQVEPRSGGGASGAGPWTPRDALHDAARVLEVSAGVALIVLAVALPVGLIAAAAWAAVRVGTRRRRERLLDMA
jgi:hypothetical protein